ncbi:hypothetical protein E2C01_069048 [Portunus trituberculatus]|uniref:Uncharacterized protein n=1 Tax=Portunus trituberculatus TaxID=210409 RepID=A0A5B7HY65_PORTR|nr:hypothetical protein [Portunus trituberculatus]
MSCKPTHPHSHQLYQHPSSPCLCARKAGRQRQIERQSPLSARRSGEVSRGRLTLAYLLSHSQEFTHAGPSDSIPIPSGAFPWRDLNQEQEKEEEEEEEKWHKEHEEGTMGALW